MPRQKRKQEDPAVDIELLPNDLKADIVSTLHDPVAYSRFAFGHDHWGVQRDILRSVRDHKRTSVKACHSSGKTYTAGDAALWWVTAFPDGIVVTTAPTWTQVQKLLWGEIRNTLSESKVKYPEPNDVELKLGPKNYAMGLSTNEGVRFQGWHGHILIIIDEAPGVRPDIYDAIEGIRAGGVVHVLLLGNPIIPSGPFYDSHTTLRKNFRTFTISAFHTPNFNGVFLDDGTNPVLGDTKGKNLLEMDDDELNNNVRPYLTRRDWVKEKHEEWGYDNPLFQAKVLGIFPTADEFALITLAWIEGARWPSLAFPNETEVVAGIDVAGPGEDNTVLYVRRGVNIIHHQSWSKPDPRGDVTLALMPFKQELQTVHVDEVGIGYHFMTHLRDKGFPVHGVNVGKAAMRADRFANVKAEAYWGLRDRFKAGRIAGLTQERTMGQLTSIRWDATPSGQVKIESKKELRARGVKSPDDAEALMLCFMPVVRMDALKVEKYTAVRR